MKMDYKTRRLVEKTLNTNGWRGYRKELAERVDMDTGAHSFNYAKFEYSDLVDKMTFLEWGPVFLDPVNGHVELDIWLYSKWDLVDTAEVHLYDLGDGLVHCSLKELEPNEVLQAAVAARRNG